VSVFDRHLSLFGNARSAPLQQIRRICPLAAGARVHGTVIGEKILSPLRANEGVARRTFPPDRPRLLRARRWRHANTSWLTMI
jgi:hypothetical protein